MAPGAADTGASSFARLCLLRLFFASLLMVLTPEEAAAALQHTFHSRLLRSHRPPGDEEEDEGQMSSVSSRSTYGTNTRGPQRHTHTLRDSPGGHMAVKVGWFGVSAPPASKPEGPEQVLRV